MHSTEERVEMLEALRIVDEVIAYQTVGVDTIEKINFDILALGEDHKGKRFDEVIKWSKEHEREVLRLKRTPGISSSDIKRVIRKDNG